MSKFNDKGGGQPIFPIKLDGPPMYLLRFLLMLDKTTPIEIDRDWWTLYLRTKAWS